MNYARQRLVEEAKRRDRALRRYHAEQECRICERIASLLDKLAKRLRS